MIPGKRILQDCHALHGEHCQCQRNQGIEPVGPGRVSPGSSGPGGLTAAAVPHASDSGENFVFCGKLDN